MRNLRIVFDPNKIESWIESSPSTEYEPGVLMSPECGTHYNEHEAPTDEG